VQAAYHKTTNKHVSIWTFDKRAPEIERLSHVGKERVIEYIKAEAQALRKMRHPCILEMVEPLEESRSELIFATEPVIASLSACIKTSKKDVTPIELDEVEIQKRSPSIVQRTFIFASIRTIGPL